MSHLNSQFMMHGQKNIKLHRSCLLPESHPAHSIKTGEKRLRSGRRNPQGSCF